MSNLPLRALLVDDERSARLEMRRMLAACPAIAICGEAANSREALEQARLHRPEAVFVDIEMPGGDGFSMLQRWPDPKPAAVFTTAYPNFAARSYDVDAVDYLLKPIAADRLAQAVDRVLRHCGRDPFASSGEEAQPLDPQDSVLLREGEQCWLVPVRNIRRLEAEGNYSRLFFDQSSVVLSRSLGQLEDRLPASLFLRANRSELVNLTFVEKVEPWFSGCLRVRLRGDEWVELSRRQSQLFRNRLAL